MPGPFTFLTITEFEQLGSREKLSYLSDAMCELQRTKRSEIHGWENLFAQPPVTQQQQQEQPPPEADPPKSK